MSLGYTLVYADQCMWNKRHHYTGELIQKPTALLVTRGSALEDRLGKRCDRSHEHGRLLGTGAEATRRSGAWTPEMGEAIVAAATEELVRRSQYLQMLVTGVKYYEYVRQMKDAVKQRICGELMIRPSRCQVNWGLRHLAGPITQDEFQVVDVDVIIEGLRRIRQSGVPHRRRACQLQAYLAPQEGHRRHDLRSRVTLS